MWHPRHAFVRFSVYRERRTRLPGYQAKQLLAYEVVPVDCLRQGYRSVPLRGPTGQPIANCSLFVFISKRTIPFDDPAPARPPSPSLRLNDGGAERGHRGDERGGEGCAEAAGGGAGGASTAPDGREGGGGQQRSSEEERDRAAGGRRFSAADGAEALRRLRSLGAKAIGMGGTRPAAERSHRHLSPSDAPAEKWKEVLSDMTQLLQVTVGDGG